MSWLLPPLAPTFEAALRDVHARSVAARVAAADRLGDPDEPARALPGLLVLAADRMPQVRAAALRALSRLQAPGALPCLLERIADPDALVRELAALAIAALDGPGAAAAMQQALQSPHPEVRFQAVAGLAERADPGDYATVAALLEDHDARVRANAARGLAAFGALGATELRAVLRDPEVAVRSEAAIALAQLGDTSGAMALRDAFDLPEFALDALDAAAGLGLRELCEPAAAIAESVLKPLLSKTAAARALIRLEDPRGVPALRGVLRAFRSTARSYAVRVVGELGVHELTGELLRLTRRFRGTDPEALVDALAQLLPGDRQARDGLEDLARRNDPTGERARHVLAAAGGPIFHV